MKKTTLLFTISFLFLGFSFSQTKQVLKGNLIGMTSDSLLTITVKSGIFPSVGQEVKVSKSFKSNTGFKISGTMGVANGKVKSATKTIVKVQVTLYTSTKVVSGKRVPMLKKGADVQLKWEGTGEIVEDLNSKYIQANSLKKSGKYDEAIPVYDELIKSKPQNHSFLYGRGYCYYKKRDYEKSIKDFSEAIKIKPNFADAIYMLSHAYSNVKKYDLAAKELQKLLNLNLSSKEKQMVSKKIANWKLKSGDKVGACDEISKLKITAPNDNDINNFYNKNCANIAVPDKPTHRLDAKVISQSADGYSIKATIQETPKECYDGGLTYRTAKELKAGTIIKCSSCSKNSNMSTAVLKVQLIIKGVYTFKVLYWSNSIGDSPWVKKYKTGDVFMISW